MLRKEMLSTIRNGDVLIFKEDSKKITAYITVYQKKYNEFKDIRIKTKSLILINPKTLETEKVTEVTFSRKYKKIEYNTKDNTNKLGE